ncbi:MAG: hydrolase, partial [Planctomycetia bacterium]
PGLQGPIDDAFTKAFICVIGSSTPWNEASEKFSREELSRFGKEWKRYFRGELIIKKDIEVTESDLKNQNIILFGDPGSNSLISKSLPKLPIEWTQKTLQWRDTRVDSSNHLPALIYPSPFSPSNYLILNSGHTFREADLK